MSHYIYTQIHLFIQAYVLSTKYVVGSGGIRENKIEKVPASWNLEPGVGALERTLNYVRKPECKLKKMTEIERKEKEMKVFFCLFGWLVCFVFLPLACCVNLAKTLDYLFSLHFLEDIISIGAFKAVEVPWSDVPYKMLVAVYV